MFRRLFTGAGIFLVGYGAGGPGGMLIALIAVMLIDYTILSIKHEFKKG